VEMQQQEVHFYLGRDEIALTPQRPGVIGWVDLVSGITIK